jgi:hypothetical protein
LATPITTVRRDGLLFRILLIIVAEVDSKSVLADHLKQLRLPCERLYLSGTKGFDLGPDNIRVIVYEKKKKGCCGKCKECGCNTVQHVPPAPANDPPRNTVQ